MAQTQAARDATPLLLIEDDPGDARLVREMLRDLDDARYSLDVESSLESGIERSRRERYAVILLDLLLPGCTGLEALFAMRRTTRGVPIVVVSGIGDESLAVRSLRAGAQDYLVKGRFEAALLEHTVRFAIERHRAEEIVERSASILQATLDSTVDGIVVVDRERRIVTSNRRFLEMWGLSEALAPGCDERPVIDRLAAVVRDPVRFTSGFDEIYAGGDDESYDLLDLADGRVYERYSSPHEIDGRTVGRVWSYHDVTERKHAIDALRESAEAARTANRAKTDFLAFLSHELRAPLNTIQGLGELLAESELGDEPRDYVDLLGRAASHMRALLDDILDLSKIEAGKLELECAELSPRVVVEEALALLAPAAREKGIELACRIGERVPARLIGDPLRLRQILLNLGANALRFTDRGRVVVDVDLDPDRPQPGFLLVSVSDTGEGIPPEKLDAIFESFVQADAAVARRRGGTGLGLAICRRLVHSMGGEIRAESRPGEGSTFRFTVALEPLPRAIDIGTSPIHGARILIASVAEGERRIARHVLASLHATAETTDDGARALALLSSPVAHSVIVVDAKLPPRGGLSFLEDARPILGNLGNVLFLLPEKHRADDVPRLAELGVGRCLVRPFRVEELIDALSGLLERKKRKAPSREPSAARRVLVAEDSADNRSLIHFFLRKTPWQVEYAKNGEQAVARFMEKPFDVVLMDVQMPVLDGLSATRAIRSWETAGGRTPTPILALSAHAIPKDVSSSIAAGCTEHLTTPIRRNALVAAIERSVRGVAARSYGSAG